MGEKLGPHGASNPQPNWRPRGWEQLPPEHRIPRDPQEARYKAQREATHAATQKRRAKNRDQAYDPLRLQQQTERIAKSMIPKPAGKTVRTPDPRFMTDAELLAYGQVLSEAQKYDWAANARPEQLEPDDYAIWLMLAGRGWGKTRTLSETVRKWAEDQPGIRIAIIAQEHRALRDTVFEGVSGLKAVIPAALWNDKAYKRGLGDVSVILHNGSIVTGFGLPLDTQIPTPAGWTEMGNLCDGDQVFDESGSVCHVTQAHAPYVPDRMYRITFSDGTTQDADGDHLWTTWAHLDSENLSRLTGATDWPQDWPSFSGPMTGGAYGPKVRTTDELAATLYHPHKTRKIRNHRIPTAGSLDLKSADLPLDPYVLGYWLGDGATHDTRLACHDDDFPSLQRQLAEFAPRRDGSPGRVATKGLSRPLRLLGVLHDKYVPVEYLRASREQRLSLLQGLMDSDGTANLADGQVSFSNTRRLLVDAVFELACSLGERPTIRPTKPSKSYGPNCLDGWRVGWTPSREVPFRLPRKAGRVTIGESLETRYRSIVSVEPIEPVVVRCITVDSTNAMYLAGRAFVPTHNTAGQPDALRGPEFDRIAFDEFAAWPKNLAEETMSNARMCLRASRNPKIVIATTPKRIPHLMKLVKQADEPEARIVVTGGRTSDNTTLSKQALDDLNYMYGGTRKGRQELEGELLTDVEGTLWSLEGIDEARWPQGEDLPAFDMTITGVDPSGSATGDATGIVTLAYVNRTRQIFVLECKTTQGLADERYNEACLSAYRNKANIVVVEGSYGGDNNPLAFAKQWAHLIQIGQIDSPQPRAVISNLRGDKVAKVSPFAAMYQQQLAGGVRRVWHLEPTVENGIAILEDEMTSWAPTDKKSPNSIDALAHAGRRAMKDLGMEVTIAQASSRRRIDRGWQPR